MLDELTTFVFPAIEFERPDMLVIDMTNTAYYSDGGELVRVQGAPEGKSFD